MSRSIRVVVCDDVPELRRLTRAVLEGSPLEDLRSAVRELAADAA